MAHEAAGVIEMKVPCEARFLSVVRLAVAGAAARAGLGVGEADDLKVAVSEACTNAIEHAFDDKGTAGATMLVRLKVGEGEMRVEVVDEGAGFDPKRLPTIPPEERDLEKGGLGLYLMQGLMDEVKVESAPGSGTKITLVKRLAR